MLPGAIGGGAGGGQLNVDETIITVGRDGSDPVQWVLEPGAGWRPVGDASRRAVPLEEVVAFDSGEWISIVIDGEGCMPSDVAAALPPAGDREEESVEIDDDWYGPFGEHGWLKLDPERIDLTPPLPAYDVVLFSVESSEEGGFTSGSIVDVLGEVRPGLLVRYYNCDGTEVDVELFACDPSEYPDVVRAVAAGGTGMDEKAVARALSDGPGYWTGDELDPDNGSPTFSISIDFDPRYFDRADARSTFADDER